MLVLVQRELQLRSTDGAPIVHIEIGKLGSMEFLLKLVILQGLPRVPGYPSGTRVINYPCNFLLADLQRRFALYYDLLYE